MIKYLYYLFVGIVVVLLISTIYFLYGNFYLTLANSKEVTMLVGKVSVVSLNTRQFQDVISRLKEKETPKPISPVSDPFYITTPK